MGTYIYEPLMGSLQKHGALAGLRRWTLERDDSGTIYPVSYTHLRAHET